jgi:sulfide:quinone oxidoreductase
MNSGKTILILGGGIGGIVAATELRKKLSKEHRVIVIERLADHVFPPSLLWVASGARNAKQISKPINNLSRKGIDVVHGTIQKISPAEKKVVVDGKEYVGDYLIIATGAELAPETVPGLMDAGHNLYTLEGAQAIRAASLKLNKGRVAVLVCSMPFKCPAAPYEAAMLLESDFRKRGLATEVSVDVYSPEPGPMPVTGPEVSKQVRNMVESKGVTYYPQHAVTKVDPATRKIHFAAGEEKPFDLLVYVPPHRAPAVVREAGLLGESGWLPVDRSTMATKYPNVYAIGDIVGIPLSNGKPLPKAGVLAHGQAEVVANNIAVAINGNGDTTSFNGHGECFLEVGDGMAGLGKGNFYAEPNPDIKMTPPGYLLHFGKVLYEKYWLYRL